MADKPNTTRRAFLSSAVASVAAGTVLSSAALAVPAVAAVAPPGDTAFRRVRKLQKELSETLAELASEPAGPDYVSVVRPEGAGEHARTLWDRDIYDEYERLRSEQAVAIAEWNAAEDAKERASIAYKKWQRTLPRNMATVTAVDQTARNAWIDADEAAWDAHHKLMQLLRVNKSVPAAT